jgi:HD-like signal output (HDOD) protein/prolyl-tRNA editing enzyme YbaK/EbsC (Cys-tRNA(Pro) deacylase)
MSTSIAIRQFLDNFVQETPGAQYALVPCPWDAQGRWQADRGKIPPAAVARPVILRDEQGTVMAVIPLTDRLNLETVNAHLRRRLQLARKEDYARVFADCSAFILPALGKLYDLPMVIDNSLLLNDFVYVSSGDNEELIRLTAKDFQRLCAGAWFGNGLARQISRAERQAARAAAVTAATERAAQATPEEMRERIERTTRLPAMPSLAQKIIQLNANPYAHAEDLAKLVEKDPSLTAQIVRYAQSPFYGYQGKVVSVRQAISRVLGYDMVMNIALGIAAARPFKIPMDGPLGLQAFWRHATYTAALCQALCNIVPRELRPRLGTAYLAGLLHNFGSLLLGHLFPYEFERLRQALRQDGATPLWELERGLLGTTHMEMGAWLMREWNMPAEVTTVLQEHHHPDYDGAHANYVHLVCLANSLLKDHGLGDAVNGEIPAGLLARLGLEEEAVKRVVARTLEGAEDLDSMARQLVA